MTRPPSVLCRGLWSLAQGFGCGDCFSPCLLTKPLILHSASGLPPNLIPTPVPVITGSLGCAGGPHADGEGWVSVGTVFRDGLWWRFSARCRPRGPCGFGDAWAGSGLTRSPVRGHVGEMPGERVLGGSQPQLPRCGPEVKAASAKHCCKRVWFLSPETLQTCPNGSAGVPYLANRLGHTLLNLSAFRLPEYLLVPSEKPRWVPACGRTTLQIRLFQMRVFLDRSVSL